MYSKIISDLNNYDKGTTLDLIPTIPIEMRKEYINKEALVKALLNTILTILFVHTDFSEELLETIDLSTISLIGNHKKETLEDIDKQISETERVFKKDYEKVNSHIAKLFNNAKAIGTPELEKRKLGQKTDPIKVAKVGEINEKLKARKKERKEILEKYKEKIELLKSQKEKPITVKTNTEIFKKVRNSLAHGNMTFPARIDLNNLDETVITITDIDQNRDNKTTFEGIIKLVDLLKSITKDEIMLSGYIMRDRFLPTSDKEEITYEETVSFTK